MARHTLDKGTLVHSFAILLEELSAIMRNTCRTTPKAAADVPIQIFITLNAKQQRALELIRQIRW